MSNKQTFLQYLSEARSHPELNPKVSINQQLDDFYSKHGENSYVSFTSVDKLGINPRSTFKTPLGIYAYPISYVREETDDGQWMRALPFAGKSEYANLFRATGNIVDVSRMSAADARGYYKQMAEIWANRSGEDWKTSVDQVEDIINSAHKQAVFPDYAGGRFWFVTREVAALISNVSTGETNLWQDKERMQLITEWNKLFRDLGIDGCVDYGVGIIHTNEPTQAVFFASSVIADVKRVYNKWSPEEVNIGRERGETNITRSKEVADLIANKSVNDVLDIVGVSGSIKPEDLKYIRDRNLRLAIISEHPNFIAFLDRSTKEEQVTAIRSDPDVLLFRKMLAKWRPGAISEAVAASTEQTGSQIVLAVAKMVKNLQFRLPIDLFKIIVERYRQHIGSFYLYLTFSRQMTKIAVDAYQSAGESLPRWLIPDAAKYDLL